MSTIMLICHQVQFASLWISLISYMQLWTSRCVTIYLIPHKQPVWEPIIFSILWSFLLPWHFLQIAEVIRVILQRKEKQFKGINKNNLNNLQGQNVFMSLWWQDELAWNSLKEINCILLVLKQLQPCFVI